MAVGKLSVQMRCLSLRLQHPPPHTHTHHHQQQQTQPVNSIAPPLHPPPPPPRPLTQLTHLDLGYIDLPVGGLWELRPLSALHNLILYGRLCLLTAQVGPHHCDGSGGGWVGVV